MARVMLLVPLPPLLLLLQSALGTRGGALGAADRSPISTAAVPTISLAMPSLTAKSKLTVMPLTSGGGTNSNEPLAATVTLPCERRRHQAD